MFKGIFKMRMFKRAAAAAMNKLSGSLTIIQSNDVTGKAYFAGGQGYNVSTSGWIIKNIIRGFVFATETISLLSAVLSQLRSSLAGVGTREEGYLAAGNGNGGIYLDIIDCIKFDSDTAFNSSVRLNSARTELAGMSYNG